jgi:hypothetical protein
MLRRFTFFLVLTASSSLAETKPELPANVAAPVRGAQDLAATKAQRVEQVRTACIEGRRYVAGKVVQVVPEGLVVESGYSRLLSAPFNKSWVVSGTASVSPDPSAVEERKPDAVCVGLVLLSNIPKRPGVKAFDYVVIHGYPAKEYTFKPVPGVEKVIRRFSASLDRAVEANLDHEQK